MTLIPRIKLDLNVLNSKRSKELKDLFAIISANPKKINIKNTSLKGSLIYGISDGFVTGSNFKEWRFSTKIESINANYFEIWNSLEKNQYYLERSYLQLYLKQEELFKETEYVFLHCDASEPDDSPHSFYKQSLHIHIEAAKHPLPKAHLALYNGRHKDILSSIESFNKALKESLILIDSQIITYKSN